eukprot:PhM_4_TR3903/c0_g1_i1/m.15755
MSELVKAGTVQKLLTEIDRLESRLADANSKAEYALRMYQREIDAKVVYLRNSGARIEELEHNVEHLQHELHLLRRVERKRFEEPNSSHEYETKNDITLSNTVRDILCTPAVPSLSLDPSTTTSTVPTAHCGPRRSSSLRRDHRYQGVVEFVDANVQTEGDGNLLSSSEWKSALRSEMISVASSLIHDSMMGGIERELQVTKDLLEDARTRLVEAEQRHARDVLERGRYIAAVEALEKIVSAMAGDSSTTSFVSKEAVPEEASPSPELSTVRDIVSRLSSSKNSGSNSKQAQEGDTIIDESPLSTLSQQTHRLIRTPVCPMFKFARGGGIVMTGTTAMSTTAKNNR